MSWSGDGATTESALSAAARRAKGTSRMAAERLRPMYMNKQQELLA
jgi:hypothetical protein